MAEKPDFDKIFANKATSVHEWDSDNYNTGWGFLGETPPPYELFDSLQRENDTKAKYLYERTEEVNTDLNDKYDELKTGLGGANTALQQHNVDENAHADLFQRALVTGTNVAANIADWNTLTESRTYKITGATFAADKHQPVGAVGTGELIVLKNGDDTIAQVYYANSVAYDKAGAYHRINIGGTWTDWVYNITNKGGNITGDFTINGKLTVDTIQVKENLYIGDYNPADQDKQNALTAEALQKLQDQIIAPTQNIYVDQKDGNDDNDGTALSKAVRTLDKAVSLIRPYVKTTVLNLRTYEEDYNSQYNTFGLSKPIYGGNGTLPDGNIGKNITDLTIQIIDQTKKIEANIIVPYGCYTDGTYLENKPAAIWGNFLTINCDNINLLYINPVFQNIETDKNFFLNAVSAVFGVSFSLGYTQKINLPSENTHLANLIQGISYDSFVIQKSNVSGEGLLLTGYSSLHSVDDPKISKPSAGSFSENGSILINKCANIQNSVFNGNVLGTTKGLSSNILAAINSL